MKKLFFLILGFFLWQSAYSQLDPVKNFAKVTVSTGYDSGATTIVLSPGHGAKLPSPATDGAYNLVWWAASRYADPADDPAKEIVRVTARSGDTLTVTRGQESTADTSHNKSGYTYKMILSITKKMIDDISGYIGTGSLGDTAFKASVTGGSQISDSIRFTPLWGVDITYDGHEIKFKVDSTEVGTRADVIKLTDSIATHRTNITSANNKNGYQDDSLTTHRTNITSANNKNGYQDDSLTTHRTNITSINNKNAYQDDSLTTHRQNITSINSKNTAQDDSITALRSSISSSDTVSYATNSGNATTATYSTTSGGAPPTGSAGGHLTGTYPNPSITSNVITGSMIMSSQVVKSIQGLYDNVRLRGAGGTSITTNGDTIIVTSIDTAGGGGGISAVQSTGSSISVTDPTGPTVNIDIATAGVNSVNIRDTTIQAGDIKDNQITTAKFDTSAKAPYSRVADTAKTGYPIGSAGGGLTGTYPNPTIAANGITASSQITDGIIQSQDIRDTTIQTGDIKDAAVTTSKFSATAKSPLATYADSAGKSGTAGPPTGSAGGDLTGTYPNPTIGNLVVTGAKIANNTITAPKIDSTARVAVYDSVGTFAVYKILDGDTVLGNSGFPYSYCDPFAESGRFALLTELGNASLLTTGTVDVDLIATASTSTAGKVPATTASKYLRTNSSGDPYWGDAPAGTTGGSGSGDVWSGEDTYTTTSTRDSHYVSGLNSYDQVSVFAIPADDNDLPVATDFMTARADTNFFIALRVAGDTSGQPYGWLRNVGVFSPPSGVTVSSSHDTVSVSWTPSTHRVIDSQVVSVSQSGFDSTYAEATSKTFVSKTANSATLTGLSELQPAFVSVWSYSKSDETSLFGDGTHDSVIVGQSAEPPSGDTLFNATTVTSLKFWAESRFVTDHNDGDDIENSQVRDSSGLANHLIYPATKMGAKRAKYQADQATGIHGSQPGIQLHDSTAGTPRDTLIYLRADSVAQYFRSNAAWTVVMVAMLHDTSWGTGGHGLQTTNAFWSVGHSGDITNYMYAGKTEGAAQYLGIEKANSTDGPQIMRAAASPSNWKIPHIYEWIYTGTTQRVYRDGSLIAEVTDTVGAIPFDFFTIGCMRGNISDYSGYHFSGMTFFAVCMWQKEATLTDRQYYLRKLDDLYGTPYTY